MCVCVCACVCVCVCSVSRSVLSRLELPLRPQEDQEDHCEMGQRVEERVVNKTSTENAPVCRISTCKHEFVHPGPLTVATALEWLVTVLNGQVSHLHMTEAPRIC